MPINIIFFITKPKPRQIYKKKVLIYNIWKIVIDKFINKKLLLYFLYQFSLFIYYKIL